MTNSYFLGKLSSGYGEPILHTEHSWDGLEGVRIGVAYRLGYKGAPVRREGEAALVTAATVKLGEEDLPLWILDPNSKGEHIASIAAVKLSFLQNSVPSALDWFVRPPASTPRRSVIMLRQQAGTPQILIETAPQLRGSGFLFAILEDSDLKSPLTITPPREGIHITEARIAGISKELKYKCILLDGLMDGVYYPGFGLLK